MLSLILSLFIGAAYAAPVSVKFATIAPAGTPWADSLEEIKERVLKESKNQLKVKTYLGGQLGGELEILQKVRRGQVEGGGLTCGAMSAVIPELDILEIPFLFESSEEADFVLDNYLWKPFQELFEAKGLVLITWAENGWRSIGHKTKLIKSPTDLKGVKIRSQESKVHLAYWKRLGAAAQAISTPEVLPALQTGVVEAFDNTPLFTLAAEWQSAIKFYTVTDHIYQAAVVVYSKKFFDKMNAEQKKILLGSGNEQAKMIRSNVRKLGDSLIEVLKESGVEVGTLSTSEKSVFKKSADGLAEEMVKSIGGKSAEIYKLILEGKAAFKKK
jgi:TRAP-type transport system periplasmic protein